MGSIVIEQRQVQNAQDRTADGLAQLGVTELPDTSFVCVGDAVDVDQQEGFLRGHGTQVVDDQLMATVCGGIKRVDRLVSVLPLKSRYTAQIGDVVVGRVIDIAAKRWRIDLNAAQQAALMLSAVNLPGGVQRRRNAEDELNMRFVYDEGDLIGAEVQQLHADGSIVLHTRSQKYGKLEGGQLITVPANLIKRQKQHFHHMEELGIHVIFGCNGMVWISCHQRQDTETPQEPPKPTQEQMLSAARAANALRALAAHHFAVSPASLREACQLSQDMKLSPVQMLQSAYLEAVVRQEAERRLS